MKDKKPKVIKIDRLAGLRATREADLADLYADYIKQESPAGQSHPTNYDQSGRTKPRGSGE